MQKYNHSTNTTNGWTLNGVKENGKTPQCQEEITQQNHTLSFHSSIRKQQHWHTFTKKVSCEKLDSFITWKIDSIKFVPILNPYKCGVQKQAIEQAAFQYLFFCQLCNQSKRTEHPQCKRAFFRSLFPFFRTPFALLVFIGWRTAIFSLLLLPSPLWRQLLMTLCRILNNQCVWHESSYFSTLNKVNPFSTRDVRLSYYEFKKK